jgi:hypothetical protein
LKIDDSLWFSRRATSEQHESFRYGWNDAKEGKVKQYYVFMTEDEHEWYEKGFDAYKEEFDKD